MIDVATLIKTTTKQERQTHLKLSEPCLERGGDSTNHRGVLAQYLDTTIPSGKILLCHACHNGKCSNPKHLYWGVDKENFEDSIQNGRKTVWEYMVAKYGIEEAKKMNSKNYSRNLAVLGGQTKKSDEHKQKIAKAVKESWQKRRGVPQLVEGADLKSV